MYTGRQGKCICCPFAQQAVLVLTQRWMCTVWMQAGPVASVNIPESKDDNRPRFGFCHYHSVVSRISDIPDYVVILGSSRERHSLLNDRCRSLQNMLTASFKTQ